MVPYRESKLTRLFQHFFSGKGSTRMIVNVNNCASNYDETLHVMKFSAVAKQVNAMKATKNISVLTKYFILLCLYSYFFFFRCMSPRSHRRLILACQACDPRSNPLSLPVNKFE